MLDIGGPTIEHKKWIHCFENVTTILFLVAISEYDQLLFEEQDRQPYASLTLFDSAPGGFVKTSIILFLNKIAVSRRSSPLAR